MQYVEVFTPDIYIAETIISDTPDKIDDHIVLGEVHNQCFIFSDMKEIKTSKLNKMPVIREKIKEK